MMRRMGIAVLALMAGACAQPMAVKSSFNPVEVQEAMKPGRNSVKGFAVLRTVGGEARTCAGLKAYLTPPSTYADERMQLLYGSTLKGVRELTYGEMAGRAVIAPADPAYARLSHSAMCDGQGNFLFENVADGDWYLVASVAWAVGGRPQGGHMMRRIHLQGAQTLRVELP